MGDSEVTKSKPELTIGILNKHSADSGLLVAAIGKTLAIIQEKQKENGLYVEFGQFKVLTNEPGFPIETSRIRFSLLLGPGWEFKYADFVIQNAERMTGAIFVVSVLLDTDEYLDEQLGFIKNLGISPLLIFLNTGAINYPFATTNEEVAMVEARVRRILANLGYPGETLFMPGNLISVMASRNTDPTVSEYAPIIELFKTIEQYFLA